MSIGTVAGFADGRATGNVMAAASGESYFDESDGFASVAWLDDSTQVITSQ